MTSKQKLGTFHFAKSGLPNYTVHNMYPTVQYSKKYPHMKPLHEHTHTQLRTWQFIMHSIKKKERKKENLQWSVYSIFTREYNNKNKIFRVKYTHVTYSLYSVFTNMTFSLYKLNYTTL